MVLRVYAGVLVQLNATSEMIPVTWPEVAHIHPFAPAEQVTGYAAMIADLAADLCDITGFAAMSMQPNVRATPPSSSCRCFPPLMSCPAWRVCVCV